MSAPERDFGADLSAYLDGELSPEQTQRVEKLLAESAEARSQFDGLSRISEGLSDLPRAAAPETLVASIQRETERRMLLAAFCAAILAGCGSATRPGTSRPLAASVDQGVRS